MSGTLQRPNTAFRFHDLLVVLASGCLVLDGVHFPGTPFPTSTVCAGLLVVLAYFRRPFGVTRPAWFTAGLILLIGWLAVASWMAAGLDGVDVKRLLNVTLWAAVALTLASGRLNVRRVGIGLALGIVFGVIWGLATFENSSYAGRLTGVFGDPNTAGLIILTFTSLALPQLNRRWVQAILALSAVGGIIATFSRTTWLATACVLAWVVFAKHISRWVGVAAVAGLVWWSTSLGEAVLATSQFSSRAGSDALRARILSAEQVQVDASPLIGHGLGSAHVPVDHLTFFFHSSYISLRQEGGWVALVIYLALLVAVFLALTSLPKDRRTGWGEAALIGVAICAVNLGEVFLTVSAALSLGFAAWTLGRHRLRQATSSNRLHVRRGVSAA
jgi:hypothetical protein